MRPEAAKPLRPRRARRKANLLRPRSRSRRSSSFSTPFMSHAPSAALSRRHDAVRAAIAARGLDGLVVTSLPNVLYLTNFTGSAAIVVIDAERVSFLTDARYVTAIDDTRGTPHECPALDVVIVEGSYDARLAEFLRGSMRRIGFEAAHLTCARHD